MCNGFQGRFGVGDVIAAAGRRKTLLGRLEEGGHGQDHWRIRHRAPFPQYHLPERVEGLPSVHETSCDPTHAILGRLESLLASRGRERS